MEGSPFWWGIIAVVLGGALTQLSGWITRRWQRADRREDRENVRFDRREAFELQHLVEVNQLLRVLRERADDFVSVKWSSPRLARAEDDTPQAESGALMLVGEADAALSAQVGFILDDEVRALVHVAADCITNRVYTLHHDAPETFEEAMRTGFKVGPYTALTETAEAVEAAYDAISERVRTLYADRPGALAARP